MAQHAEQGNKSICNWKNQNHQSKGQRKEPEKNMETQHNFQRRNCGQQAPSGTARWVTQQLAEEKPEQRIGILWLWVNPKRQAEATEETIEEINNLSDKDAEEVLTELRHPIQYIWKQGGLQMSAPIQLRTLEDGQIIMNKVLLDSGSTGSCMSKQFVDKHKLPTKKLAWPILIYNAYGTLNKEGTIKEYVKRI